MKIGDLYYGVTIPDAELKKLEQKLRRFEASIQKQIGQVQSLQQTARAANQTATAINALRTTWVDLQQSYAANEVSVREYLDVADTLQRELQEEMNAVKFGSKAWMDFARLRKQVSSSIATESEALANAERRTGQSAENMTRSNVRYMDTAQTLVTRIKNLKSELSALNYAWETGQKPLAEVLTGMERLQKAITKEIALVNQSRISIDDRNRALETLYGMGRRVQSSVDATSLAVRGYNRHTAEGLHLTDSLTKAWLIGLGPQGYRLYLVIDVLKETLGGFNTAMKMSVSLAQKFSTIAGGIVAIAGMLTAGAAIAGVTAMLEVEDKMADVAKTTNLTTEELDGLTQAFRYLSTQLPSTVPELAAIAAAAGQLGIRGQKNIYEFTEAIAQMNLVVADLGEDPATKLGRFLNVIGVPVSEFGAKAKEVAGILNELENNTASTAGEILEMAETLAQLSSVAGVSMRDILAIGAGLKSMGIEAELAGTNTTLIFMDLVRAVSEGADELDRWAAVAGMTTEEFTELARSQNGFSEALKLIAANMGQAGLTAEEMTRLLDNLGFTNAREKRIIIALAQGWQQFGRAVDVANDEAGTAASIQEELAARLDVTRTQFQLLRNRVMAIVQVIGEMLLPYVKQLIVWMNENTSQLASFGAGIGWVIDAIIVLVNRLNALRWAIVAAFHSSVEPVRRMADAINQLIVQISQFAEAFNTIYDMSLSRVKNPIEAFVDTFKTLNDVLPQFLNFSINWEDANEAASGSANAASEAWLKAVAAMETATALSERMGLNFQQRKEEMMLGLPELTDQLDVVAAMNAALQDLDGALDDIDDSKKRTVSDVLNELNALLAGIDRQAEIMEERGREYDVFREKHEAITAAMQELVFEFGKGADSPEIQKFLGMLVELGVDAEDAAEELRKARERAFALKEALTDKYVGLDAYRLEFGDLDRSQIREAFERLGNDAERLRGELAAAFAEGDWPAFESIETRLRAVLGVMEDFRAEILSWEGTMGGVSSENLALRVPEDEGTMGRGEFLDKEALDEYEAYLADVEAAAQLTGDALMRVRELAINAIEFRFDKENSLLYTFRALQLSGFDYAQALKYLEEAGVSLNDEQKTLLASILGTNLAFEQARREADAAASVRMTMAMAADRAAEDEGTMGKVMQDNLAISQALARQREEELMAWRKAQAAEAAQLRYVTESTAALRMEEDALQAVTVASREANVELLRSRQAFYSATANSLTQVQALSDLMRQVTPSTLWDEATESAEVMRRQLALLSQALPEAIAKFGKGSPEVAYFTRLMTELGLALRELDAEKALEGAVDQVARLTDEAPGQIESYIEVLETLAETYPEVADALQELINKLKVAQAELEGQQAAEEFVTNMERVFDALSAVYDLFTDDNWQSGNNWLSALTSIGASIAMFFDPTGTLSRGIEAIGGFVNKIIGDLSNGMTEVEEKIKGIAESSALIGPALAESLTVIKRVSRGGFLGWLGFTKAAVDELATELNVSMADAFAQGLFEAVKSAVGGEAGWRRDLHRGIHDTVVDALLSAFVESILVKTAMADFINEFNSMILAGDLTNAKKFAANFIERMAFQLEIATEILIPIFEELGWEIGDSFESGLRGGIEGALSNAAKAVARGEADWRSELESSIRESVADALIDAMVSAYVSDELARLIGAFDNLLSEDPDRAADFMRGQIEELLAELGIAAEAIASVLEELFGPIGDSIDNLTDTLRDQLSSSLASAMRSGLLDSLSNANWIDDLGKSIKEVVANSLIDAFVEALLVQATVADFIAEFARILNEEGREAALEFAAGGIGGIIDFLTGDLELIRDMLIDAGLIVEDFPEPGAPTDYSGDFAPASSFSLPTASASLISATPAWIDSLGAHFDKFGSYVDRLVDEGITVNVNTAPMAATNAGITAQDIRLLR